MDQLLNVESLTLALAERAGEKVLVDNVSFSIDKGNVLAMLGESGSGKTTLCRALTRLFPPSMNHSLTGNVWFNSNDLLHCDEETLQKVRRREIRYVFQEPQQALNPTATVQTQMRFASGRNQISYAELCDALNAAGIENPREVLRLYPHQLSIGMAQRVMIAMALLPNPQLLIADEPTSAMDVALRYQILSTLRVLQQQHGTTMILVTHDARVAHECADSVAVVHAGRLVEFAQKEIFFREPSHPYSKLLSSVLYENAGERS